MIAVFILVGLVAVLLSAPVLAQSQKKGDASLRIEYQYIRTGDFHDSNFEFDYWTTDSHIALLSGDYTFADRWTVYGALPYVQKRFNAGELFNGDPHNPNDPWWIDFQPPDKRFIDDERFHGGLQDLSFGLMYLALDGPFTLSPYIGYGFPTNNYPFYAKAAIGQNLWNIPLGVAFTFVPYFSDWYFQGNVAYVFSEKPLGVNVDYWLGNISAGYFFTPRFSMNVFLTAKSIRQGLKMPDDFTDDPLYGNYPDDFDTVEWWQHDRLLGHRFANVGVGFNYLFKGKYQVSASYYTGIWAEQTNEIDRAFTLGLTRYFGRQRSELDIEHEESFR
jgi:hypothetical protein